MDDVPFRVTTPLQLVLDAFMANPGIDRYGLDIARETGLKPGSLYPILARLEHAGWLSSRWEQVQERDAGRPRRRYYALTGLGVTGSHRIRARTSASLARSLRLKWQP